jgi:hypothetical protein
VDVRQRALMRRLFAAIAVLSVLAVWILAAMLIGRYL